MSAMTRQAGSGRESIEILGSGARDEQRESDTDSQPRAIPGRSDRAVGAKMLGTIRSGGWAMNDDAPTRPSEARATGQGDLEQHVREVDEAAPGVAPIVDAAVRDPAGEAASDVLQDVGDPLDVVMDQRAAMARAVELRDDESRSADERTRGAGVVERLAEARHVAKMALAERRRDNPKEGAWIDAEVGAQSLARRDDADPADLRARGAPAAAGDSSGRDEPAAWQGSADRVGPETGLETTSSSPRTTDELTSGPGLAGGTGGAGSQN